jgi:amidase
VTPPSKHSHAAAQPTTAGRADDLWQLDAFKLAQLIRRGTISSREATLSCLSRLDATNAHLNAVVHQLRDEALAAADVADKELRRGGQCGPLHGVPITIKINVDQRGHPTDNGVPAYRDAIASEDNPTVENLRRGGAVIIGRTNTPCYSMRWFTENEMHGPTLNPWDVTRTPGGSSGGAAAAVAVGIGPIAHGNDIAGSVRYPAFCCGVAGLKPTFGRIPSFNSTATGPALISSQLMGVQGPLARRVCDLRIAFEVMAIPDPRDPRCTLTATPPPPRQPIGVALVPNPGGRGVHAAIGDAVKAAGRALAAAGYAVEEIDPPGIVEAADLWAKIAMPDVIAQLDPLIAKNGDGGIRRAIDLWHASFPHYAASDTLTALGQRYDLLRNWQLFLERHPIVVMPVSTALPFPVGHDLVDATTTADIIAAQAPMLAVSVLGLPAVSIPTGLCDGVPVGVQIVGGRNREDLCLDAAEVVEAHCPMPTPVDPVR